MLGKSPDDRRQVVRAGEQIRHDAEVLGYRLLDGEHGRVSAAAEDLAGAITGARGDARLCAGSPQADVAKPQPPTPQPGNDIGVMKPAVASQCQPEAGRPTP